MTDSLAHRDGCVCCGLSAFAVVLLKRLHTYKHSTVLDILGHSWNYFVCMWPFVSIITVHILVWATASWCGSCFCAWTPLWLQLTWQRCREKAGKTILSCSGYFRIHFQSFILSWSQSICVSADSYWVLEGRRKVSDWAGSQRTMSKSNCNVRGVHEPEYQLIPVSAYVCWFLSKKTTAVV